LDSARQEVSVATEAAAAAAGALAAMRHERDEARAEFEASAQGDAPILLKLVVSNCIL
jgi:hypothetical protein